MKAEYFHRVDEAGNNPELESILETKRSQGLSVRIFRDSSRRQKSRPGNPALGIDAAGGENGISEGRGSTVFDRLDISQRIFRFLGMTPIRPLLERETGCP